MAVKKTSQKTTTQTQAKLTADTQEEDQSTVKAVTLKAEDFGFEEDFTVEIDVAAIADDFELGEAVGRYDIGQFGYSFIVLERLIGKEKYTQIKELARLSDGRVSSEKVDQICTKIFKDLNLKN